MNKQQTIDLLKKQMPSFYSLEQVIGIVFQIEEPKATLLDQGHIKKIVDNVKAYVDSAISNIDFDSCDYQLEMDYNNTVAITSIDIDSDDIANEVGRKLEDLLDQMKEEFESEAQVEATPEQ
jgi:hypothetical protein